MIQDDNSSSYESETDSELDDVSSAHLEIRARRERKVKRDALERPLYVPTRESLTKELTMGQFQIRNINYPHSTADVLEGAKQHLEVRDLFSVDMRVLDIKTRLLQIKIRMGEVNNAFRHEIQEFKDAFDLDTFPYTQVKQMRDMCDNAIFEMDELRNEYIRLETAKSLCEEKADDSIRRGTDDPCKICLDSKDAPMYLLSRTCGHIACAHCLPKLNGRCPFCNRHFYPESIIRVYL